jgi:hypothetical protein
MILTSSERFYVFLAIEFVGMNFILKSNFTQNTYRQCFITENEVNLDGLNNLALSGPERSVPMSMISRSMSFLLSNNLDKRIR